MIAYKPIIERMRALLSEGSAASVTYAALEARLALEKVCYDRLRQRHDYISHSQLKKWQPGGVVATLMNDVDPHVAQTVQFSMAKQPAKGVKADPQDYVQLGTEIGFDPKRIVKLWNALAKLALHVRLPEHRNDHIPDYGDATQIRAKVEEVVAELEKLAEGNLSLSGIGETVSFECGVCDEVNKRRVALLRDGQSVNCINPECERAGRPLSRATSSCSNLREWISNAKDAERQSDFRPASC